LQKKKETGTSVPQTLGSGGGGTERIGKQKGDKDKEMGRIVHSLSELGRRKKRKGGGG